METHILYPLNSTKGLLAKRRIKKTEGFKGRRKRVWKSTERTGVRGNKLERKKERKKFNPEKCNPVCNTMDVKLGLAYACLGRSQEYFELNYMRNIIYKYQIYYYYYYYYYYFKTSLISIIVGFGGTISK
jgi:hypothetical protein